MFLKGQCSLEHHAALMYLASGVLAMKYFSFIGRPMLLVLWNQESAWTCCRIRNLQRFLFSAAQADAGLNKSRNIPDALTADRASSSLKGRAGAGSTLENYHQK